MASTVQHSISWAFGMPATAFVSISKLTNSQPLALCASWKHWDGMLHASERAWLPCTEYWAIVAAVTAAVAAVNEATIIVLHNY